MVDKKEKPLEALNKLKKGTKRGLILTGSLLSLTLVGLGVYAYQQNQAEYSRTHASETVQGRMQALSNSFYESESKMIDVFTRNSKSFEPYAVYSIGSKLALTDPEGSLYKMAPISGENKSRVNYFRLEDGSYLRSVYNEQNDLISGNTQIKTDRILAIWQEFDKAQEELGKETTGRDKIDLAKYKNLERLIRANSFLQN